VSLPNNALTIDVNNGLITLDASSLGHEYLGTYTVTVTVSWFAYNTYGNVTPITLNFILTIDPCVVTDLELNSTPIPKFTYKIGETAKFWTFHYPLASMTPLCPYTLELTTQDKPSFIFETPPAAAIHWTAESLKRSDATN